MKFELIEEIKKSYICEDYIPKGIRALFAFESPSNCVRERYCKNKNGIFGEYCPQGCNGKFWEYLTTEERKQISKNKGIM